MAPNSRLAVSFPANASQFARDVRDGLSAPQKLLPAKYLYDDVGSALFEVITLLPEYGLTRAEERILHARAGDILEEAGPIEAVAELGSGDGRKTRCVLEAMARRQERTVYHAIDVSGASLLSCRDRLQMIPGVDVRTIQLPYLEALKQLKHERREEGRLLVLFLGSSLGNFAGDEATAFLRRVRSNLLPGDALLFGADLVKPPEQLIAAYDDPAGVTAAFNLNLLARINRELNADFRIRRFRHEVRWRPERNRIEMHLVSRERQAVNVPGAAFSTTFQGGESIWTETSQKFNLPALRQMASDAGFTPQAHWIDDEWPFAESLWTAH